MGNFLSPVPKIDYAMFVKPSTKKESVKSMVRIDDTVVVEKENGELVVLYYNKYKSFSKAAYICQVWRGVEKILKCLVILGRITKKDLKTHFDAANKHQKRLAIKNNKSEIDRFKKNYKLSDDQYNDLIEKAERGDFVDTKDLYDDEF